MKQEVSASYPISIFIAGNSADARRICREYCMATGFCVTVTDTDYIYKGGQESGVVVGIIQYPRFPEHADNLWARAETLANELIVGLCQSSMTIQAPDKTVWFSRRET